MPVSGKAAFAKADGKVGYWGQTTAGGKKHLFAMNITGCPTQKSYCGRPAKARLGFQAASITEVVRGELAFGEIYCVQCLTVWHTLQRKKEQTNDIME